jgi:hypothetical protein
MRILMILILSSLLWAGSLSAEAPGASAMPAADLETPSSTMTPASKPSCGEAAGIGGDLSYLSLEVRPKPFPNECIDCTPCSVQGHCGVDSNGYFLGVCSPPGSSYCHYLSYSACTCY